MDKKDNSNIIIGLRITEKATEKSENAVYVFNVAKNATKPEIRKAIEAQYKVKPVRVNVAKVRSKTIFMRGKKGVKSGGQKAYVFLKKGEKIEIK